jgi:hypothetical protein
MKRILFACLLAVLAFGVSLSSPAQAQFFVSRTGIGTTCTSSSPCQFFEALSLINNPGLVDRAIKCIDEGAAGIIATIQFTTVIDCPGGIFDTGGHSGAALTINGTSTQVVILRNMTFRDINASPAPAPFIQVTGGATVIIENCRFENLSHTNAIAIQFTPNNPAAQLIIRDSVFANNGVLPASGGGLQVAPIPGGSASVVLERVSFNLNVTAMVLSGAVNATMINSTVSASRSNGILVGSGSTLVIKDSTLMYNVGSAVSVTSGGTLRLSNNDIESNQIGISNSGGQALTYSNNRILGNGSTATLTPIQGGQ